MTNSSTVWVLEEGEQSEGGSVIGVFKTRCLAERHALKLIEESTFKDWELTYKDGVGTEWEGGCDWVRVTLHYVQ